MQTNVHCTAEEEGNKRAKWAGDKKFGNGKQYEYYLLLSGHVSNICIGKIVLINAYFKQI